MFLTWDSLDILGDGVLEIVKVMLQDCGLHLVPGVLGSNIWDVVSVDLARVLALKDIVALLQAVLAGSRWSFGTSRGTVTIHGLVRCPRKTG